MPIDREITKPMLGTDQEPSAITWKSTLRSPAASPRGPRQSRSRTRSGNELQSSMRSRTPSPMTRSSPNLRKSHSGKLNTSFSKSAEMKEIENDYIKNLQQQVYFLELESNYLREQAKKATEMHPKMTAEAERMLTKLRSLQIEVDGLQVEVRRRQASIDLISNEKAKVLARLAEEEQDKERIKRLLQQEIDEVKQELDRVTLDNSRLNSQMERLMSEKDYTSSKLREAQHSISIVREQLTEKTEQHRLAQLSLEEKRAECMDAEARAEKVEEHYLNTTQRAHDRQINEYKDEVRRLKQQLKEQERQSHDERYMKNKAQDDIEQLTKTNFILKQQMEDLECQLLKEKELRNHTENSRTEDLVEISMLSDREKELTADLQSFQVELTNEKERSNKYLQQLKKQQQVTSNLESTNNSVNITLVESEAKVSALENENSNLRRDKEILTDHAADLQRQLAHKDGELSNSRLQIKELEKDLSLVETEKRIEENAQSEKWREFESLAEGMKNLSRTMARTTNPTKSPRSSVKFS